MIVNDLRNCFKKAKHSFSIAMGFKPIAIIEFPTKPLQRFLFVFRTSGLFRLSDFSRLKPYLCASNK